MPQLFVLSGADVGRSFDLKDGSRIGRSPECEVVLRDASISRRHAHLERRGDAWWLVDDGSRNGITVERVRVPRLELHDQQEFLLGEMLLRFRADPAAPAAVTQAPAASKPAPPAAPVDDEIELEGVDTEIDLGRGSSEPTAPPRELEGTVIARRPAASPPRVAPEPQAAKLRGSMLDTSFGPRGGGPGLDARKTAPGERILQYGKIEGRAGLASADLSQLPTWLKLGVAALALALAVAVAYFAFSGASTFKERVVTDDGDETDVEEPVER